MISQLLDTADTDVSNNYWPQRMVPTRFDIYLRNKHKRETPIQRDKRAKQMETEGRR